VERSLAHAETLRKRKIGLFWTAGVAIALIVTLITITFVTMDKLAVADKKAKDAIEIAQAEAANEIDKTQKAANVNIRKAKLQADINIEKAQTAADFNIKTAQEEAKYEIQLGQNRAKRDIDIAQKAMQIKVEIQKGLADSLGQLAKEKADEFVLSQAKLNTTNKKTRASKLSLEAYDRIIDGEYNKSKEKADSAVKIYIEIKEDYETDVLYRTYYSILKNSTSNEEKELPVSDYIVKKRVDWNIVKKLGIDRDEVQIYTMKLSKSSSLGALGLKSGKIILFDTATYKQTDTISIGKNRVTSIDFNEKGDQMIASSVDYRFTIIPLEIGTGKRNQGKQLIRIKSLTRIEEIDYLDGNNTIRTVGGKIENEKGEMIKNWRSYPATVEELYKKLN
tara:strand:- start:2982 stop:4160 length:1179 start_codon:yes stop_codon:yes gene_type:complete